MTTTFLPRARRLALTGCAVLALGGLGAACSDDSEAATDRAPSTTEAEQTERAPEIEVTAVIPDA